MRVGGGVFVIVSVDSSGLAARPRLAAATLICPSFKPVAVPFLPRVIVRHFSPLPRSSRRS